MSDLMKILSEGANPKKKRKKLDKNEFIDDEAELSEDEYNVSEDEVENSDDDEIDLDLVDKDAPELDSDEEEQIRGLYHKQLESEDRRAELLLKEHLEDRDVAVGQRRRRKFRWQTKELMEHSLARHYDPDDDDSQECDDEDDDFDYDQVGPTRLRRPTAEASLLVSTRITTKRAGESASMLSSNSEFLSVASTSKTSAAAPSGAGFSDDSNSNTFSSRMTSNTRSNLTSDMNRFLYRDKEIVEALSTKEIVITTREEKDKVIQRELKRVLQSKSIFDQLYS